MTACLRHGCILFIHSHFVKVYEAISKSSCARKNPSNDQKTLKYIPETSQKSPIKFWKKSEKSIFHPNFYSILAIFRWLRNGSSTQICQILGFFVIFKSNFALLHYENVSEHCPLVRSDLEVTLSWFVALESKFKVIFYQEIPFLTLNDPSTGPGSLKLK